MKKLLKHKPLVGAVVALFLIFCGLVISWLSSLYTLNHLSLKTVTTTQMASAMRQDEFWSSYRFNTLLFDGKVKSISSVNDKTTLALVTSDTYGVRCEVVNNDTDFRVGTTYKFAVETYQAERQSQGVLLHNCINLK